MKKICLLFGLIATFGLIPLSLAADASPPAKVVVVVPAKAPVAAVPDQPAVAVPESKAPEKAAEAPTGGTQKWWQGLLVTIVDGSLKVLLPILSVLFMFLVKKWGLKLEQERLDWCLDKALGAGEQKLKQLLKDGKPIDSPGIKSAAVETGTKLLEKYGLAKKFGDWLAEGIEARLGEKITEAGGAKLPGLKALVAEPAEEELVTDSNG